MGEIDHHAEPLHLPDDGLAEIGQPPAGPFLLDAVRQLVAQIPGDLHRPQTEAVEVAQVFEASLQRFAALEAQDEVHRVGRRHRGQILAMQDQLHLSLRGRHFRAQGVDVLQRSMQKAIGPIRVGQAVAGDGIEGRGDVGALQARQRDVQHRILLSLGGEIIHLEHIAVPFHDDRLPVHARDIFTRHSALP
jgi:hypothetical protein